MRWNLSGFGLPLIGSKCPSNMPQIGRMQSGFVLRRIGDPDVGVPCLDILERLDVVSLATLLDKGWRSAQHEHDETLKHVDKGRSQMLLLLFSETGVSKGRPDHAACQTHDKLGRLLVLGVGLKHDLPPYLRI